MKKLLNLAIAIAVLVSFNACKSGSDNPEKVAEKFLNALNKKDYNEAKKYGTESTIQMIAMMESFKGMTPDTETKDVKIENMKCAVDGEKAKCTYNQDGKEEKIDLVKKDNKWLVDMKKENPGGEDLGNTINNAVDAAADSLTNAIGSK